MRCNAFNDWLVKFEADGSSTKKEFYRDFLSSNYEVRSACVPRVFHVCSALAVASRFVSRLFILNHEVCSA